MKLQLGPTGIEIEKNGFGCLPIQRISKEDAAYLLRKAADGGMNYFDTARAYSDSEEKLGYAFAGMREQVVIATKTMAQTGEALRKDLEASLKALNTGYIDVYQFHNPAFVPRPGGEDGLYDAALEAKKQGKIRHIAITNHRLAVAHEAIDSGLYALLQFPYSYLAGPQEQELVDKCKKKRHGFCGHEGDGGGTHPGRHGRRGLDGPAARGGPHLGGAARVGAGPVPRLRAGGPPADSGVPGRHWQGPLGAGRRLLPGLRLLYALPDGD